MIKLASNENPNGCSPKVAKAIANSANMAYMYPDDSLYELKDALSKKIKCKMMKIFIIGAGSDQS